MITQELHRRLWLVAGTDDLLWSQANDVPSKASTKRSSPERYDSQLSVGRAGALQGSRFVSDLKLRRKNRAPKPENSTACCARLLRFPA